MLRFTSALAIADSAEESGVTQAATGASHCAAERAKVWKTAVSGALEPVFYKNGVLLTKWKCHAMAVTCYRGFLPYGKLFTGKMLMCESACVQSASRNAGSAPTSLQALCNGREERLQTLVKDPPRKVNRNYWIQ